MESHKIIQVEEKVPLKLLLPLSIQHMFAMFGASVLVPFIFGINPAIVLFMNGVGTLIFIVVTKAKSPAYLGSSFAFLAPAGVVISKMGYPYALGGFVAVGFCGCILSFIIYKCGTKWIDIVLPPAAMGPVVALIGLELSSSAASNAGLLEDKIDPKNVLVFAVTLGVAVFGNILFRGFLSVIPILIAVVAGYLTALACGILDFTQVVEASWFAIPNFQAPKFDMGAILMILPVLLVITSEHIGHQVVTSKIIGRDLLTDPGLHRSLFGDNFSTMVSGLIGSVPTTTYGENIGVMAVTKVYSVRVIGGAAVLSIICSFEVTPPLIPGHEFSGVVKKIGANVNRIKVGDRVSGDPNDMCGECYFCKNAMQHFCTDNIGVGTTVDGGFAEYVIMHEKQLYTFSDDLSFIEAAMAEPVSCCLHGIDLCHIKSGDTVLVIGGGPIGMIMLQLAKNEGATKLILSEPVEEKRELALKLGATKVIDPINEDVQAVLDEYTPNVNVVIECVGNIHTQEDAVKFAGKGATVMFFGLASPEDSFPLKPDDVFKKELHITSSFINPYTYERAIQVLESKTLRLEDLITNIVPLDDIADVFTKPEYRRAGKVMIKIAD